MSLPTTGARRSSTLIDAAYAAECPLFDVNPTRSGNRVSARPISDRDDPTDRDIRLLIEGRDAYALSAGDAAGVLARVTAAVSGWRGAAARNGVAAPEVEHMAGAFRVDQLEHAQAFVAQFT